MFAASKTASVSGGYQISRSLRFNSDDSAYLNRTPASAGNRRTWTWSGWVKRSSLTGTSQVLFGTASAGSNNNSCQIRFNTNNKLEVFDYVSAFNFNYVSTQVFRDVSAWYHVVAVLDTTQATSSNRVKVYINGIQITSFDSITEPPLNLDALINSTVSHGIGRGGDYADLYFSGYMTEVNFIDGQALTPSSFGETNAQTGVWQPKAYSGSYGTNGFYLNFSDNSNTTAATLGKDYSGNGNNWTPNNFSVTAGSGNDSLVDSPTSYGTDTGVGGTVRGNYCTLNPLDKGANISVSDGNLTATVTSTGGIVLSTFGVSSGKWYWEMTRNGGSDCVIGIANASASRTAYLGSDSNGWGYIGSNGNKTNNATSATYGASYASGDVVGVVLDMDAGTVTFYKNGSSQGTAYSGLTGTIFAAFGTGNNTDSVFANFGQRPFAYTAPSGYKALCTQNLPTPTIGATSTTQANLYFNPVTYTGTGSTQTVTVGFETGLLWGKERSGADRHWLADQVRGLKTTGYYLLSSNNTDADTSSAAPDGVTAITSTGFTLGANTSNTDGNWSFEINQSGSTYVAWNWKANGSGSTNTAGSITSTVSANTTSGFSVVTYTGNGTQPSTVGHGLGVAPSFVIVKTRNSASYDWNCYHISLGNTQYIALNTTAAASSAVSLWNNTTPTSTVFTVNHVAVNTSSNTYVAYCFAEVAGYSKFGYYTGNGSSDGPFVFTGFRPAFVMVKRSSSAGTNWQVLDTKRSTYNVMADYLYASASNAEAYDTTVGIDSLSNGFKIRGTDGNVNSNGATYIYMAFAETPTKFSLAR